MRITLDIADDVLQATKDLARREAKTAGQVVSELLRQALTTPRSTAVHEPRAVYGFAPFAPRGSLVTSKLVDQLLHDDAY